MWSRSSKRGSRKAPFFCLETRSSWRFSSGVAEGLAEGLTVGERAGAAWRFSWAGRLCEWHKDGRGDDGGIYPGILRPKKSPAPYPNVIKGGRPGYGPRGARMALGRTGRAVAGRANARGIPPPPGCHNGPDDIGIFTRIRSALLGAGQAGGSSYPQAFGAACRGGTAVSGWEMMGRRMGG